MEKENGGDPSRRSSHSAPPPVYRLIPTATQPKITAFTLLWVPGLRLSIARSLQLVN